MRPSTNKTVYEIWKDKKPNLNYFHVFGCTCYILNDREHLGNFQAKSYKGIFLGNSLNSHAYRIFNLCTKTILESINVVIDDLNDVTRISNEDDAIDLTDEIEKQLQNTIVAPYVAIETESKSEMKTCVEIAFTIKLVDITDPTTKDSPTRIQKNHLTKNIICDFNEGMKTRNKPKRNDQNMVRYVCYTSSIEPKNVKEALLDEYWVKTMQEELE